MKKALILSCILFLLSFAIPVKASHYMGGEITWECLSNGNYRFHLRYYRECSGIAYPNSITLNSNSPAGNITLNLYPNNTAGKIDISPVCNPDTIFPHITCNTVTGPNLGAVEEWHYTSDQSYPNGITLNGVPPPSGWVFSHGSCCRNPSTNIVGQPAWYLQAVMYPYNNQNANPCFDSSPVFSEKPLSVICGGYPVNFNYNAVDPDLDSLFCEWAPPLQSANTPIVNYAPGYSYSSPVASITANPNNVPATIDTINGEISFLSYSTGAFVTNVKVTSFKCGIKVSEVFREMQFVILICGLNDPPIVTPPFQNPVTGLFTDYIDTVFAGDTVNFSMSATDFGFLPNSQPQTITLQASGSQFDTSFSNPTSGCPNPPCATLTPPPPVIGQFGVQTTFNWITDCSHLNSNAGCVNTTSIYNFIVKAEDDFCPAPGLTIATITVVIIPKDTTEFVFVQDTSQPYNFNFFDNSSGTPTSWFWDFGDGTSSNNQNPSHLFANIGTYNVCLTPSDSLGNYCYKPVCHQVTIGIQAAFTYTQDTSLYNMYHFNDNSIGPVNSWEWDFDDSTTSNVQNPSHMFLNPGIYNIKLTVVDTNFPGISSIDSQQITIGSYNCLVADYSFTGNANDSSGNGYHAIVHGATLTTDRFGNPNSAYEFDGINDYIDTETSFDFQERTVSVWAQVYDALIERVVIDQDAVTLNYGAFQVTFRNGNLVGNAGGDGPYDIVNNPHLNQWYHIVLVRNSLETKYYVNGNLVIIGTPSSSGSVTYQNPELVIGTYRGENGRFFSGKIDDLLIFDCELDSNQIDSLYNLQNYGPNCQAGFYFKQDIYQPLQLYFNDSSSTNINNWYWDFGDGLSSTVQNPVHYYTIAGIYNVCLIASDSNMTNCVDTICKQVSVITGPVFNISGQVFAGTSPIDLGYTYLYSHNIGSIVPVDTFEIDTIGAYYFHQIATGFYIIKAELDTNSIYNNQYFPTYYGNVLTWATSSSVNLIQNLNNIDISMIAVPGPIPGPGNIGGNLSSSGNKGGKLGDPVPDVEVLLFDDQNAHLTLDYSNSSGSFIFANIAYGTYVVHPEITGKSTISATITIDADNPTATLHFVIDSNNITLAVDDLELDNGFNISEVYPNPFNNDVYIDISFNKPTRLKMSIFDLVGKEISTQEIETTTGVYKYKLDVDNLPQNIYYLQIALPNGKNVVRKLVKIR